MPDPTLKLHVVGEGIKETAADVKELGQTSANAAQKVGEIVAPARQVAQATKDTSKAAEEAAQANKKAAQGVNELGEGFEKGAAAGRVFSDVAKGDTTALINLAPAIKTVGTLLKTNMIGALMTIGAIAANVIVPLVQGFNSAKEKIDATTKSAEALNKAKFGDLQQQLTSLSASATKLAEDFERAQKAQEQIDNAAKARELSDNRRDKTISETERTKRELEINQRYDARSDQRSMAAKEKAVEIASGTNDRAQQILNDQMARESLERWRVSVLGDKSRVVDDPQRGLISTGSVADLAAELKAIQTYMSGTALSRFNPLYRAEERSLTQSEMAARGYGYAYSEQPADKKAELQSRESEILGFFRKLGVDASTITEESIQKLRESSVAELDKATADAEKANEVALAARAELERKEKDLASARGVAKKTAPDKNRVAANDAADAAAAAREKDRATAEDRKKAEEEIRKNRAAREAAAQARGQETGAYYYTDEELAAQKKELEDFDKKFPNQTKAPSKPTPPVSRKSSGYEMVDGVMRPVGAAEDPELEQGADGIWRKKGAKPTALDPNKIRRTPAAPSAQPAAYQPASAGQPDQLPDLAGPINDATKAVESAAPALAEQLQPAVDASKEFAAKVPELKLDGAPLAAGIQASTTAITALQQANTSVLTDVLSLVREQNTTIKTLATQTNSLRVEVGQLRSQLRAAA